MHLTFRPPFIVLVFIFIATPVFAQGNSAPSGDVTEQITALLVMLFILSLITERVANFFKLKLSGTRQTAFTKRGVSYYFKFNNTAYKSSNVREEKKREYRVLKINLFFGFVVALAFRADLFQIIDHINEPTAHIGWDSFLYDWPLNPDWNYGTKILYRIGSLLVTVTGCFLVGSFLSFGSKFWHDLLDLILQVKEYRRMMSAEGTALLKKSFSQLSVPEQEALIRAAINENYELWKAKYPYITGADADLKQSGGVALPEKALIFYVSAKKPKDQLGTYEQIPNRIFYQGYWIPTDVLENELAVAQAPILCPGDNYTPCRIGTNVSRKMVQEYGTVGLKVKREFAGNRTEHYMLSCFHVLLNDRLDKDVLTTHKAIVVQMTEENDQTCAIIPSNFYCKGFTPPVATRLAAFVKEGVFSNVMDAALARLPDPAVLDNETFYFDGTSTTRVTGEAEDRELNKGTLVFGYGSVSGRRSGYIRSTARQRVDVLMKRPGHSFMHYYQELIATDKISEPGDSGGPVLTEGGKVVGIIVAGNGQESYVLRFRFIKNVLHVKL